MQRPIAIRGPSAVNAGPLRLCPIAMDTAQTTDWIAAAAILSFQLSVGKVRVTVATRITGRTIRPVSRIAAARRGGSRRGGALSPSRARTLAAILGRAGWT